MGSWKTINIVVLIIALSIALFLKCLPLSKETKLWMGYPKTAVLNFTEATAENQYESEEHRIVTEDRYILTAFRITKARNCHQKKKPRPVLLMHGLLQNSDVFLDAGPSAGLAYLLSDACYDVWVGNNRGNNYARKHLRLNPDKDADFWEFSVDEIGFYDVPATMDYILKKTGADKVNYIGFSQGCGVFFAMCSERPEYSAKTGIMISLAPGVHLEHLESRALSLIFNSAHFIKRFRNVFGIREILSKGSFFQELLEYVCQFTGRTWSEHLCMSGGLLDNYYPGSATPETQKLVFSHFWVGTSLNNLVRYAQVSSAGRFIKMDHWEDNMKRHNRQEAPEYNLRGINVPVVLIQGRNDKCVNIIDTEALATTLPNVIEMIEVADPKWTHFDMIYSKHIKTMIFPKIDEHLQKFSASD